MKALKTFGLFSLAVVVGGMLSISSAKAVTIFSDDFESYADTAAMQAVWDAAGAGSLDGAFGNPGQSMAHPGGTDNIVTVPVQQATAANPLVYTADIYDDGVANKRLTAGLRFSGVANLLEMGMYNDPTHYSVRAVLPGPNWAAFDLTDDGGTPIDNEPIVGWHRYQLTLDGSNATFTIDLGSTGIINGTVVLPAAWNANGVDSIRLGGPSSLSSPGGGGFFDNVSLVSIPEPTTLALAGLAGLCMLGRRRS